MWSVEAVTALCENYEKYPCLYNTKSMNYHNKNIRLRALNDIAEAVSEVRPGTTVGDCKVKLVSLRTQFVAENNKINASKKTGCASEEVYVPSLWYFKHLRFLSEHVVARRSKETPISLPSCSVENQHPTSITNYSGGTSPARCSSYGDDPVLTEPCYEEIVDHRDYTLSIDDTQPSVIHTQPTTQDVSGTSVKDTRPAAKKFKGNVKKVGSLSQSDQALQSIVKALKTPTYATQGFATYVCGVLDGLKDKVIRIQTTKKIMEILTDAQMQDINSM